MQAHFGAGNRDRRRLRDADEAGDEGLRFLGPLHELVAIGLHRPALDALCAGQDDIEDPPIDRTYLLKILDEEVSRQFGHPLRPILELVLNAIDAARPPDAEVQIFAADGRVEVRDAGDGMGLEAILSRLLIPFATDKRAGVDLGRFGVGFFSVLGIGLVHPESFALHIATGDGSEGWSIRVAVWPAHAFSPHVTEKAAALMCSVRQIAPMLGTRARVTSALLDGESVRAYMRESLHFFPAARATVLLDGAAVNDGRLLAGGRLVEEPALAARFHIGGRGLSTGISAAIFHAGVKVEHCLAVAELSLLDFPSTVELTEGRDALKIGPEVAAVAAAFHRRLARIADESGADRAARDRLAETAAQVSALMLRSVAWDEVAGELARALLGPRRCIVSPERREAVLGFLGPAAAHRLFVPESFWAEREWQPHIPGERELLEDELEIDPPESLAAAARRRAELAGLALLASRALSPETTLISLCRARSASGDADPAAPDTERRPGWTQGPLPCLGTRRMILVRDDCTPVRQPAGWLGWYALRAAFDRASGVREADLERDLIVGEPLMPGGDR